MLRRIVGSWPYALALGVGFVLWILILRSLPGGDDPLANLTGRMMLARFAPPIAFFIGGVVLGLRRGLDRVVLLVCAALVLVGVCAAEVFVWGRSVSDLVARPELLLGAYVTPLSSFVFGLVGTFVGSYLWQGLRNLRRPASRTD